MLARQIRRPRPGLGLLQHTDDLTFREPCSLHLSVLQEGRTLNPRGGKSQWQVTMGQNPGTSEAANLTALKVRGCDLGPRFADLIEASGHVPCFKAVHMNAPSTRVKSIEKLLAPRAVPHMRLVPSMTAPFSETPR